MHITKQPTTPPLTHTRKPRVRSVVLLLLLVAVQVFEEQAKEAKAKYEEDKAAYDKKKKVRRAVRLCLALCGFV